MPKRSNRTRLWGPIPWFDDANFWIEPVLPGRGVHLGRTGWTLESRRAKGAEPGADIDVPFLLPFLPIGRPDPDGLRKRFLLNQIQKLATPRGFEPRLLP